MRRLQRGGAAVWLEVGLERRQERIELLAMEQVRGLGEGALGSILTVYTALRPLQSHRPLQSVSVFPVRGLGRVAPDQVLVTF